MTRARVSKPVLDFKGRMMTLTILRLLNPSVEILAKELDRRVRAAPEFFRHLAVVIDVAEVAASDLYLDLPGLVELLRTRALVPVGIRGGDERWAEAADAAGLSVFPGDRSGAGTPYVAAQSVGTSRRDDAANAPGGDDAAAAPGGNDAAAAPGEGDAANGPSSGGGSLLVTEPVRSGQQIYARDTDLVVLSTVSPGAEVLADGHLHVYGALNGRALAGVRGDTRARIFCKSFRAELVSIAGVYSVSEHFDEALAGKAVQVSLKGDTLHFERL